jgi:hypothetical protein
MRQGSASAAVFFAAPTDSQVRLTTGVLAPTAWVGYCKTLLQVALMEVDGQTCIGLRTTLRQPVKSDGHG